MLEFSSTGHMDEKQAMSALTLVCRWTKAFLEVAESFDLKMRPISDQQTPKK